MRKILIIAAVLIGFSFSASTQVNWGIKAGLNISSFSGFGEYDRTWCGVDWRESQSLEQSNKLGFHVGVNMQCMFTPQAGIESGLFFSTLGSKTTQTHRNNDFYDIYSSRSKLAINPMYLQLPVQLLYKINLTQNIYLYPSAGLYFGYGIGGKIKHEWEERINNNLFRTINEERNVFEENFVDGYDEALEYANRFDMGLIAGLTFQYSKVIFGISYLQSLTTFPKRFEGESPTGLSEGSMLHYDSLRNRNVQISVGFFF